MSEPEVSRCRTCGGLGKIVNAAGTNSWLCTECEGAGFVPCSEAPKTDRDQIRELIEACHSKDSEIERLTQHKRILLELIREGMSVGHSIQSFVKWQRRAEFIIRNEGPLPETETP